MSATDPFAGGDVIQLPHLLIANGVLSNRGGAMSDPTVLKAPLPWPGGKSKIADLVWDRIGNVDNFIEPFAGSLAVLLRRPADHFKDGYRVETANDLNHFIVNMWRAIEADPDRVAEYADNAVCEAQLHAVHKFLIRSTAAKTWRKKMAEDPEHFDAKIAGWFVWGACAWIGSGWCDDGVLGRPQLTDTYDIGRGVNASPPKGETCDQAKRPLFSDGGIGHGVNAEASGELSAQVPLISGSGDGVYSVATESQQIPRLADHERKAATGVCNFFGPSSGTCDARRVWLTDWMRRLSDRLRLVRTCYGHWSRICNSDSTLTRLGLTGVFLDSPYCLSVNRMHQWVKCLQGKGPIPEKRKGKAERNETLYATDKGCDLDHLVAEVHLWCLKWGSDPMIRICVAGYEGEHKPLEELGWEKISWKAPGGYSNQRKKGSKTKSLNPSRERLWFNPACVPPERIPTLFDGVE